MYTPCSVTWRTATATATLTPPVRSSINSWAKIGSNATPWGR